MYVEKTRIVRSAHHSATQRADIGPESHVSWEQNPRSPGTSPEILEVGRRSVAVPNDDLSVSEASTTDPKVTLLAIYDRALPQVYGYLLVRVRHPVTAEDLTAETFLAAAESIQKGTLAEPTIAWLVTVARNKLVDHWRRLAREDRKLALVDQVEVVDDDVDLRIERARAQAVLAQLGPHHRSALTLRYLDGLSVPEVAEVLDRTVHATEALLVRARNAFRARYLEGGDDVD